MTDNPELQTKETQVDLTPKNVQLGLAIKSVEQIEPIQQVEAIQETRTDQDTSEPDQASEPIPTTTMESDLITQATQKTQQASLKTHIQPMELAFEEMETIKPAINDLPMTVQESSGELNQTKTEGNAEDTNVPKSKQVEGGVPPRVYLDKTVVPTLLEGMKLLATERPSDPLAYLGQFLLSRSNGKQ